MTKKINLTEDHLKLIPFFFIQEKGDNEITIDTNHLLSLGSHLLEDIAFALGRINEAIPNTENDIDGRAFNGEFEAHMLGIYDYISSNLFYIETLIHQFACKGGLKVGEYECKDNEMIWKYNG